MITEFLDVGAGIGRVSRDLLLNFFDKVSLLECTESFIEKARENIPADRIDKIFPFTMQEFRAQEEDYGKYDLIWIQWVIIYASDGNEIVKGLIFINLFRGSCFLFARMFETSQNWRKTLHQG